MHWLEKEMQGTFNPQDMARGETYERTGRVKDYQRVQTEYGITSLRAQVMGTSRYHVTVELDLEAESLEFVRCDCIRYADKGYCKHAAAVIYTYIRREQGLQLTRTPKPVKAQPQKPREHINSGDWLLKAYVDRSRLPDHQEPVRLQPKLSLLPERYPELRLAIGRDRLYAVKNIRTLVQQVARGDTYSYGKDLAFRHQMSAFDQPAQALLQLLNGHFPSMRSIEGMLRWNMNLGGQTSERQEGRELRLEGREFDQFFDLYRGQNLPELTTRSQLLLEVADPVVELVLTREEDGAILRREMGDADFFGDPYTLYARQGQRLLRCSPAFRESVHPLLEELELPLRFTQEGLPTLAGMLSQLEDLVQIRDPDGLLAAYRPEDCTACFYFDAEAGKSLSLDLKFRYGDQIMTPENQESFRRDLALETRAFQLADRHFGENGTFAQIPPEERILQFLTQYVQEFQEIGEVYLTERLQRHQISAKTQPAVGISVSDGLLTLDLDTGEFPAQELEALYQSLLKKKKYHRLQDGRFLALDGSSYERLAQAAHMLQLGERDLSQGSVTMPAFRGLYLQELLGDQNEVAVRRDNQYRQMIRAFKTVEDSDHQIPPEMEPILRPYQRTGFRWLKTLESNGFGGLLADEMGLGKTIQLITFLLTVPRSVTGKTNLVVCPASLILNWGEELQKFAPNLKVELLLGNTQERQRQRDLGVEADVWVTSYDLLKRDIADYADRSFYACILDEGQNIKNQSTQASKAVKRIDSQVRFVLTGTPVENRLSELWNLFDFLMPGYLFTHNAFVQKLEKPIVKSENAAAMRQLQQLVQPFILRRLKKDVLRELPEKIEYLRRIPLSDQERKVYQAGAHQALTQAAAAGDKIQILALLTQLRQLCCDPNLCFDNYNGPASKLDACMELCESMAANGHQILLFSQFTSMLDRIRVRLDLLGISHQTLDGSTPKEKRAQLVKTFQQGTVSVFLISLKAGGTGLNLTNADVVIHYDPWWNQSAQNQATDRAHRIGQQNCVQVYKLIAQGTIEEKILALQERKLALADVLNGDPTAGPLSRAELLELLQA